uniref:Ribonuclease VapC n=1 Tax=uncultured bacterium A1Q1_fos_1246 TaxID=1256545 RepID=L7W2G4_9BACT|nr:plasmid stability protein [uncultured bacterium A1Q1_fos_1246]
MNYLLDTNVISELVAEQPSQKVVEWIDTLTDERIYLSAITIGELKKGIEKLPASQRKELLREWLTEELLIRFAGRILSIDTAVMLTWGQLTATLEQRGRKLPAMNSLIVALALQGGFTLVTRNAADFRDTGVTVLNPWL